MKKVMLSAALVLAAFSCKKKEEVKPENPVNPNETELITTLLWSFTEGSNASEFKFKDVDGEGGNAPTIDTIRLKANTTYTTVITLLDETKNPADTISNEVMEEDDEHQFFFVSSEIAGLTISYESYDVDANNVPLGILPKVVTGNTTGIGKIKVTLKHQAEDKPKTGNGDSSIGDTDIEVTFPVKITN
ncbi:MAG: hypothetical protein MUF42_07310 [Cytophagaceae bacterium]|jgi:hypothetical protein|nr:hypothetical protein [Cytophagaceae bacterium]